MRGIFSKSADRFQQKYSFKEAVRHSEPSCDENHMVCNWHSGQLFTMHKHVQLPSVGLLVGVRPTDIHRWEYPKQEEMFPESIEEFPKWNNLGISIRLRVTSSMRPPWSRWSFAVKGMYIRNELGKNVNTWSCRPPKSKGMHTEGFGGGTGAFWCVSILDTLWFGFWCLSQMDILRKLHRHVAVQLYYYDWFTWVIVWMMLWAYHQWCFNPQNNPLCLRPPYVGGVFLCLPNAKNALRRC